MVTVLQLLTISYSNKLSDEGVSDTAQIARILIPKELVLSPDAFQVEGAHSQTVITICRIAEKLG